MFFTSLALPLSPSLPTFLFHATSRIPSWYIHGRLCLRACSQKWIAHDRRASERANSPLFSFLLAYSVRVSCMCTHTFAFSGFFSPFFLSLFLFFSDSDDECIEDIVFQACSYRRHRRRRYTYIYYSFANEREKEEKRRISSNRASKNLYNDAISFSRPFYVHVHYAAERKREKRRKKRERIWMREEYIYLQSTIYI
jgi:hypothetical protein